MPYVIMVQDNLDHVGRLTADQPGRNWRPVGKCQPNGEDQLESRDIECGVNSPGLGELKTDCDWVNPHYNYRGAKGPHNTPLGGTALGLKKRGTGGSIL